MHTEALAVAMTMPPAYDSSDLHFLLRRFSEFMRRQRWYLIVVSTSTIGLSIVFAYMSPAVYTAKASFVVERAYNPVQRDQKERRPLPPLEAATNIRTLVVSRPVIEAVVDKIRPYERTSSEPEAISEALGRWGLVTLLPLRERYINQWGRRLTVQMEGDVVEIGFAHANRRLAVQVTNLVVDEFVKRYLVLHNPGKIAALRNDLLRSLGAEITTVRSIASKAPTSGVALRSALAGRLRVLRLWSHDVDASVRALQSTLVSGHPRVVAEMELASALTAAIAEGEASLRRVEGARTESNERRESLRNLQITFHATSQAVEQLRLAQHADIRTANIRIVEYADEPPIPGGDKLLRVLMALLVAPLFALVAARVRENLAPRAAARDQIATKRRGLSFGTGTQPVVPNA
jgi:uncharacterized protein involved in exopolysaccharide biosynthesis